jgi:hypothetical protein
MVHLPGEVAAHAKVDRGHEALQIVIVRVADNRNYNPDRLGVKPTHQEYVGLPAVPGKLLFAHHKAAWRVRPAVSLAPGGLLQGAAMPANSERLPIERIRAEVARRVELEKAAYHQMLASVEELCRKGALAGGEAGPAIFVDGMANLIAAEEDRERLRQMLLALEAKQRLVELLTAYVDGRQQEVRVVVGPDLAGQAEASQAMQDLVLIGAPARLAGANLGTVAVIAPTRIQYQEMIQAVRYIARLSERLLELPAGEDLGV